MKTTVLKKQIVDLILPRLSDEYKAHYQYQAISNWANNVGFLKAAKYFHDESEDELKHAMKLQEFLVGWNVTPDLPVIKTPKLEFKSLVEAIEMGYNLELELYHAYNETCGEIFNLDIPVYQFLTAFLEIQTKSVAEYSDMLNTLDSVEPTKFNLLLLEEILFS